MIAKFENPIEELFAMLYNQLGKAEIHSNNLREYNQIPEQETKEQQIERHYCASGAQRDYDECLRSIGYAFRMLYKLGYEIERENE